MPPKKLLSVVPLVVYCLVIVLIVFTVIYGLYIHPAVKLHTISDPYFLKQFMKTQLEACKDYRLLNTLSSRSGPMTLDYWYMYYHIRSKDYTYYTLFNKINRFTEDCNFCIYGLNHSTNEPFSHIIPLHMNEIDIKTIGDTVSVKKRNLFELTINFATNDMTYDFTHSFMNVHFVLKATDWNTNQATFFPRYQPIRYLMSLDAPTTKTKDEWMVDSPCTGDLVQGTINGQRIGPGTMWFDTYSGTNYHYLGRYFWFYIHTDTWIIYILQYQKLTRDKPAPILIKNIKQNRWFYSGVADLANINFITKHVEPIDITIHINGPIGSDFTVSFLSNNINIQITSKHGTIHQVFHYLYYDNPGLDEQMLSVSDREYYNSIKNITFDEYVCQCDVLVEYDGIKEEFEARTLYEAMH